MSNGKNGNGSNGDDSKHSRRRMLEGITSHGSTNKYQKVWPDPKLITKKLLQPTGDFTSTNSVVFNFNLSRDEIGR